MLKYTTVDDGTFSPKENFMRDIHISAGSKQEAKMSIKKRGKRSHVRGPDPPHLPPIQSGSPQGVPIHAQPLHDRHHAQHINRKEIRTPYVAHLGINRTSDVATPYVLHTQITKLERTSPLLVREHSKLSNNVVELRHDPPELRQEQTFSSLQKFPTSNSPIVDKRPRGRHGVRKSHNNDLNDNDNVTSLQIQSNQAGLYPRNNKREKPRVRAGDETFSIRKKIEQFRRWHEEQYTEKLKKLKQEVDHQLKIEHNRIVPPKNLANRRSPSTSRNGTDNRHSDVPEKMEQDSEKSHEKMDEEKDPRPDMSGTTTDTKPRTESGRTWRTWRNVNESYAYNDVKKYIKDNELMDSEKELWIKKWVLEVNKAMRDDHVEGFL